MHLVHRRADTWYSHFCQTRQFDNKMISAFDQKDLSTDRPTLINQVETTDIGEIPSGTQSRIKQYTVGRILGEGAFGKVKYGLHRVSGQEVALKVIPREKLDSQDKVDRVEREIRYLQFLRHPHIIKLYGSQA